MKVYVAAVILVALILFDGSVTLSGLNQHGYWQEPVKALVYEGAPIAAAYMALGWQWLIGVGLAYALFVFWSYNSENPLRFCLFGAVAVIHLFEGLTWLFPPWCIFLHLTFSTYGILLLFEIGLGTVLGAFISMTPDWRNFLDRKVEIWWNDG